MGRFRDAITGLFTTRSHAEANPHTTIRERRRSHPVARIAVDPAPSPVPTPPRVALVELTPAERQRAYDWAHQRWPELLARFAASPHATTEIRYALGPGQTGPYVSIRIEVTA